MYQYRTLFTIDDINQKFIHQLNKHIELINEHSQLTKHKSHIIKNQFNKIVHDLIQRYELRHNYYFRKFSFILNDLSIIKSNKEHFQLIEKQHYRSIYFYKNLCSLIEFKQYNEQLQQTIKFLNYFKDNIHYNEYILVNLKQTLIKQYQQIDLHTNELLNIQYQQNRIQIEIKQLNLV